MILGNACANIELAPQEVTPQDDDREFFVAAWCLDPRFILDVKMIFILEPNVRSPGNALFLEADESAMNRLLGLRYPVWVRVAEF